MGVAHTHAPVKTKHMRMIDPARSKGSWMDVPLTRSGSATMKKNVMGSWRRSIRAPDTEQGKQRRAEVGWGEDGEGSVSAHGQALHYGTVDEVRGSSVKEGRGVGMCTHVNTTWGIRVKSQKPVSCGTFSCKLPT